MEELKIGLTDTQLHHRRPKYRDEMKSTYGSDVHIEMAIDLWQQLASAQDGLTLLLSAELRVGVTAEHKYLSSFSAA